jgi:hypothetical protein
MPHPFLVDLDGVRHFIRKLDRPIYTYDAQG